MFSRKNRDQVNGGARTPNYLNTMKSSILVHP
jgi:hypothetical protein